MPGGLQVHGQKVNATSTRVAPLCPSSTTRGQPIHLDQFAKDPEISDGPLFSSLPAAIAILFWRHAPFWAEEDAGRSAVNLPIAHVTDGVTCMQECWATLSARWEAHD